MAKTEVVKIVFAGDIGQIKNAQKQLRQENKLTAESMQKDHNGTIKNLIIQTNKIKSGFTNLSNKTLGVLGLGFGLTGLVRQAHEFNQSIGRVGDELTGLSDKFGSTSQAVGIYYGGLKSSFASMAQVKGAMMALGNEGVKVSQSGFKELTFAVADFSQITGVSADTVANLAGSIKGFGMATAGDMKGLLNSVVSIGLNGAQATQVIQQIGKSVENLAYFAKDGTKSVHALAKGISETVGFMSKLGVRTSTAISFMDKLTDPEQYGEMAGLLNRINISQADYFNMLKTEGGKQSFFDKLQQNLPALADQIQAIGNPIAQANFAKSLGVPMEIAAKLAGKTRGEIQDIIKQSVTDQKALEKKQSNAKQNQERFTEAMEQFKMNALMPLMGFVQKAIPHFMKFVGFVSNFVNRVLGGVTGYLDKFMASVGEVFGKSNSLGELLMNALAPIMNAIGTMFLDGLAKIPSLILSGFKLAWDIFMKMPIWAQFGLVAVGLVKGLAFLNGLKRGMFPTTPMFTKEVGSGPQAGIMDTLLEGIGIKKNPTPAGGVGQSPGVMSKLLSNPKIGAGLAVAGALAGSAASFADWKKQDRADVAQGKSSKERVSGAVGQGAGTLTGAIVGFKGGAALGAAIGSVIPGLGTAIGGVIGGAIGAASGAIIGGPIGRGIGKALANTKDTGEKLAKSVAALLTGPTAPLLLVNIWADELGVFGQEISNSLGRLLGTQELYLDGLTVDEAKERQKLMMLNEQGKLTTDQLTRLGKLNEKMENANTSFSDIMGQMVNRIAKMFGNDDSLFAAKVSRAMSNLGTWLKDIKNTIIRKLKFWKTSMDEKESSVAEAFKKEIDEALSKNNTSELRALLAKAQTQSELSSGANKEFYGDKVSELKDYIGTVELYNERAKKDAELKHKEVVKHLGGIGASTAKTADNTAPKKDPIREAFKALTATEMMETQYAGTNFAKK